MRIKDIYVLNRLLKDCISVDTASNWREKMENTKAANEEQQTRKFEGSKKKSKDSTSEEVD